MTSYDELMGSEQRVQSDHQATEHYAGDVVKFPMRIKPASNDNKNLDLGDGGFDVDANWSSFRNKMMKPDLKVIPGGKN